MTKKEIQMDKLYSFPKGSTIIIGCSSGPDSMALLHLLKSKMQEEEWHLVCAHVNHNVRKESFQEQQFLEEYCKKNHIFWETMTIEKYGDDNFHNEARSIRYQFFEKLVRKYQAEYLVTAHHGDDLIETILMRIVRGSTLRGYAGFQKVVSMDGYQIVRPFITLTKEDLLHYDEKYKVPYYVDESNNKPTYTRNRYRKVVLPFLKEEESEVQKKFYKFSKELLEAENFIQKETKKTVDRIYKENCLDLLKLQELDPFLQKSVLYVILQRLYQDDLILLSDKHVSLVMELIASKKKNTFVYLPNDYIVRKSYDNLYFEKQMDEVNQYEIELTEYTYLPNHKHLEIIEKTDENSNDICRLDSKGLSFPLIVRTRLLGDKMVVKGLGGHKKVKDIFINAKIDGKARDLWPIVTDSKGQIVWIPGLKKSKFDKKKTEEYDIIIKYYE